MSAAKQTAIPKPAFDFDMFKAFNQFKAPGFDMDAIMATQRKNMEAMTAAGQSAYEGMTALARRQAEVAKEAAESATKAMTDLAAATPEERVAKQADLAKTAYTSMFDNGREMMDMAAKTADEAVSVVNARFTASIDETKSVLATK